MQDIEGLHSVRRVEFIDPRPGLEVTSEQLRVRWFIGKIHRYPEDWSSHTAGENDRAHGRVIASRHRGGILPTKYEFVDTGPFSPRIEAFVF